MLCVLALAGSLGIVALPADASTAFRYWSYWNAEPGESTWRYASEGSGTRIPADGAVEGWRFGIAGDAERSQPEIPPDFTSICAGAEPPVDGKRVAVVIDVGSEQEAPAGETPGPLITECVTTSSSSTGLQILQQVADVRMDAGFVCGIDGYPARECAPLVESPATANTASSPVPMDADNVQLSATPQEDLPSDSGTPLVTAAALSLAALVGFGVWRHRRRVRV